jgi:citrate lyase subunit beta / citryl-CoA lyase
VTPSGLRLRSALYVPGANERALEKARDLAADALILDLEDSVAPGYKTQARERVCELVRNGVYGRRPIAVRTNAIGTCWHAEDLAAVALVEPDAVIVPKVQSSQDVLAVEQALRSAGSSRAQIWVMLETPLAVLRAFDIATASERLGVLVMGTNDLLASLRAANTPDRRALATSLGLCLLAARASGRLILDGVHNDVGDATGFEAECLEARRLGFDGKTLIHPTQVEPCNRAFSPSRQELEHAGRVIEVFEQAARAGAGVATIDGRLIESLDVDSARRVLASAEPGAAST